MVSERMMRIKTAKIYTGEMFVSGFLQEIQNPDAIGSVTGMIDITDKVKNQYRDVEWNHVYCTAWSPEKGIYTCDPIYIGKLKSVKVRVQKTVRFTDLSPCFQGDIGSLEFHFDNKVIGYGQRVQSVVMDKK